MSSSTKPTLPLTQILAGTRSEPAKARRSTKTAHKLKVLPEQPIPPTQSTVGSDAEDNPEDDATALTDDDDLPESAPETTAVDAEDDVEVYKQIAQIEPGTARKDALRLTRKQKAKLPRVTAYCTANSYKLPDLLKFMNARKNAYQTEPQEFDEVIYTPYSYQHGPREASRPSVVGDLLGQPDLLPSSEAQAQTDDREKKKRSRFDGVGEDNPQSEVFIFEYGVVVIWGMTVAEERRFLSSLRRFELERLDQEEMEDLNFYYANYSRIYNDVITLRRGSSYMTKLALSHALAQSVKISVFEELIATTIDQTKDIPEIISETGKIGMPHTEIMQQIGQLFILRMNINLVDSVLDSPEFFWSFPDLQPLYEAARSYLEIPQRVDLLNARVEVLQDMLRLLKESASSRHAERLERIVIALIGIEILLGIITILVDLFFSG